MIRASTILALLLLAGCSGAEKDAAPEAPLQNGSEVVATPVVEAPAPEAKATALTAEGWGPLRIGMTLEDINAALGPDSEPEAVGGANPAQCDQFRPERAPRGMLVMVEDGRLTRISLIRDAAIRTDRGIGLGDPIGAVQKAYGTAASTSPHKYGDAPAAYVTAWTKGVTGDEVAPSARGIVYEIDGSGNVGMIHAGGPSIRYVEGCS